MFRSAWLVMLLSGCVTTFERVAATNTLDEAKAALKGEAPTVINQHPPNAEAWYFGWQQCVLFVDGKQRYRQTITQTGVKASERATVDCSPEAVAAQEAERQPNPVLAELNGATTLEEARERARAPSTIERPLNEVERWYFGENRCALFVKGKLVTTHIVFKGTKATCAVE